MYKLELICVKYVPILIALITLIDVILYYFDIDFELINYIAGASFLTMILMYISGYVYKFCEYHRMFLHYITDRKTCNVIYGQVCLPNEPAITGYVGANQCGCPRVIPTAATPAT